MERVCKILIVDDEVLVRQGIKHYLDWEQYGFRIVGEASNGREGLEAIRRLQPHIVLTDIVMPIMEGEEFTRLIKKNHPDIEVIVLSSYGEFDYVRSTFQNGVADYILKPKLEAQELLRVLQNTAKRISAIRYTGESVGEGPDAESLLERLASGYDADEVAPPGVLAELFPHEEFVLVGKLNLEGAGDAGASSGAGELQPQLAKLLRDMLPPALLGAARVYGLPAAALGSAVGSEAALVGLPSRGREGLIAALRSGEAQPSFVDRPVFWAVGEAFASLKELSPAYRRLRELLELRFFFSNRTLMLPEELPEVTEALPAFDLRNFTEEIKREHFGEAFRDLREYTAKMAEDHRTTAVGLKSFLGNIVFNLITLLSNMGYEASDLDEAKYGFFREIEEASNAKTATLLLEQFLQKAEMKVTERTDQPGGANMKKLLAYIDEHYTEALSLTGLGKHFHFNPSYLSSYFTAHNKEGFSEYLNKIRVAKSEKLLREGELSISEISGQVGYSDPGYFTKVFKKHTGFSPSQYRRQHPARR
ncbi:response regulator transcription factor [Saccharibacillus sp. JS10]|uniref:response regulator transcription factor n=1 Tax=Saccharibacillus sp. JS10 TaxID=2950552 RepID=UPI0021087EA9|nr:response regulator transcription factor [Saccharibacillus sp. JS10]MCQ4088469.1 response regulator transcription factor [Saccharibacillus sp. JS10]